MSKVVVCALMLTGGSLMAQNGEQPETEEKGGSVDYIWQTVMYLPNRVFDALDIVRARVRVGPGTTASARATKLANVSAGSHMTVFVGLPGPRNKPVLNLPVGIENFVGVEASVINLSNNNNSPFSPTYGVGECGAGFQFVLLGLDIGIDPLEAGDFILGIFTIDLKEDDF